MKAIKVRKTGKSDEKGFTLAQLFAEVNRVSQKAREGDKNSKKILDSAYQKWEESDRYAL